ncbi:helix-turn-helix domain-containing protein, partial [Paracoccus sp. (in: a-proteobacteria)]
LPDRTLGDDAASLLRAHAFPGNVRELENMMRRLALTASGAAITAPEMREALSQGGGTRAAPIAAMPMPVAQPAPDSAMTAPYQLGGGNGPLSDSVEAHLQRYFDLHGDSLPPPGLYDRILREIERPLLQVALDATGGNQLRCADLLGINRNTLRKKLTELNIEVTRRRKLM